MDIDTSSLDSARKNLVILSMGFILFSIGNAHLGNTEGSTTLTILAGSITFEKPNVLGYFAWTMLGWFLLRFWQFSAHKSDWDTYAVAMAKSKLLKKWIQTPNVQHSQINKHSKFTWLDAWEWEATDGTPSTKVFQLEWYNIWRKLHLFLHVAIKTELFGQFYFPYCTALAAIILGIIDLC